MTCHDSILYVIPRRDSEVFVSQLLGTGYAQERLGESTNGQKAADELANSRDPNS